jgi:hypothetical protein
VKSKVVLVILCLLLLIGLPAVTPQPVHASSVSIIYATKDNYIDKLYPTTNYGTSQSLKVGEPASGYPQRGLLEFAISWGTTIPSGAVITDAILYMYYGGVGGDNNPVGRTIRVQRMLRLTWSETTSNWNSYKSGSSWTTAGCGSSASDYTTSGQASAVVGAGAGWMYWNILTQVQWAQTNGVNVAVRAVDSSETSPYFASFSSIEGNSALRPYLYITYIAAPTVTTGIATDVLNTSATLGGTITSTGGSSVTTRGFKYGLTQTPTWDTHQTGSFGTGSYTLGIASLSPGTLYWFRAYATNAAGTSYGSWVSFTTKDLPSITTLDASNVASTSARLNSALASDGGDDCTIEFGWGLSPGANIEDYDNHETLPGTYNTGAYPYLDVGDLLAGYTYYFRVSATNSIGTDIGEQLTFETEIILSAPTNFVGYPESTSISLSWSKGVGATNTMVRYGATDYPGTTTDGTEAYFGPGGTYTLGSLSSGKTYYFSAWGESGGNYSGNYTTFLMTTSASTGGTTPDMDIPTQPPGWFTTDYTAMSGLGFIYDSINAAADTGEIPRATAWFWLALGLAFLAGLIGYLLLGKKLLIAMICMTVVLALEYFTQQVPWWLPLMTLILVIAFSSTHKEVSQP